LLSEIDATDTHGVAELAVVVDPANEATLLEVGAQGV
jgi:hypothetical protein